MAETVSASAGVGVGVRLGSSQPSQPKLTGRAFYESIGSPRMIVAPMVDRSEFAWRLLTRSYLDEEQSKSLLAYTPMFHARLFKETPRFRDELFQPTKSSLVSPAKSSSPLWLDGNPQIDRPLFVQFCANKPEELLEAARYVAPYCDAVDLNLGCPQGIARSGHYGAFLQEDWDTIYKLINTLHKELSIPVTAKMRILETREKTLEYAKMILSAGASILTVHGRRREQKGHNTGLADWSVIRYLRDNLPPETVLFANGNILNSSDIDACLAATGVDGVMSAEGNLSDPTIFAKPPKEYDPREYWYGNSDDGKGGYRIDAVFRRYLDIIYKYCLGKDPPARAPLYIPGDPKPEDGSSHPEPTPVEQVEGWRKQQQQQQQQQQQKDEEDEGPKRKKRKRNPQEREVVGPNLKSMQAHLFQLLRPMLAEHTDIRDALARAKTGELAKFERILGMVEAAVRKGLEKDHITAMQNRPGSKGESQAATTNGTPTTNTEGNTETNTAPPSGEETAPTAESELTPKEKTEAIYKRPWWVCQPYIRPLPEEAIKKGSLQLSKKELARIAAREAEAAAKEKEAVVEKVQTSVKLEEAAESAATTTTTTIPTTLNDPVQETDRSSQPGQSGQSSDPPSSELPKAGLVCG